MWQHNNHENDYLQAKKDQRAYGMGIGVLLLDEDFPGFPGDLRNPSAYPFPIQYEVIKGVDMRLLIYSEDKSPCLPPLVESARNLERMGCKAITSECGFFALFQKEIANAVDIPVFLSPLLQVPMAQLVVGSKKTVGIVSIAAKMDDNLLNSVDISPDSNCVLFGCREIEGACEEFEHMWSPGRQTDPPGGHFYKAQREFVETVSQFYSRHPNMGAIVLECSNMPPFAKALQMALNIPLFHWGTMLDYMYSVIATREYCGHV